MPTSNLIDSTERQTRLNRHDWIDAAIELLVTQGIDAVQITVLARRIGVTRGSFYWHFESRKALLDALVDRWRRQNTNVIVDAIADVQSLDSGILNLFSIWVDHKRFDPTLDDAVRQWARHDTKLKIVVKTEDTARTDAIARLFEQFGFDPVEAFTRARVIYFTQITYFALGVGEDESLSKRMEYLEAYFRCFTGQDLQPGTAEAFRKILVAERGSA